MNEEEIKLMIVDFMNWKEQKTLPSHLSKEEIAQLYINEKIITK